MCLADTIEKSIALLVKSAGVWDSVIVERIFGVDLIVKLYEVFWQNKGVVEYKPKSNFLVVLLSSINTRNVIVHLRVNWRIPPNLRG